MYISKTFIQGDRISVSLNIYMDNCTNMCLLKKIFKKQSVRFICTGDECKIFGYPELEGRSGLMIGDVMAFFRPRHLELYIANTKTGKIRKISKTHETKKGTSVQETFRQYNRLLLVDDAEIDYEAIEKVFARDDNALSNARDKAIRYKEIGTCYGFNKRILRYLLGTATLQCLLRKYVWRFMLHP